MIFHIATKRIWEVNLIKGNYIAPSLKTDGFIHCSTINQTAYTANLFFKGQKDLVLLCIDETKLLVPLKYENPAGEGGLNSDYSIDRLCPHIYGPINNSAIIKVLDFLPDTEGIFVFPKELTK